MSLRPNRAASASAAPNYGGGYPGAAGGYGSPGYSTNAAGGGYYQQTPATSPYPQQSYNGGAYGGGGGGYGAPGGGYSSTGGGSSQGSYGGYSGGPSVYTGAAPPSTFKDKPKKKRTSSAKDNSNMPALLLGALSILFMISTLHFRGKCNMVLRETKTQSIREALERIQMDTENLQDLQRQKTAHSRTERSLNKRISDKEKEIERLEKDLKKEREIHSTVAKDFETHREQVGVHTERLASRDEAWANTVEVLQAYTQRESKRQAVERYVPCRSPK